MLKVDLQALGNRINRTQLFHFYRYIPGSDESIEYKYKTNKNLKFMAKESNLFTVFQAWNRKKLC